MLGEYAETIVMTGISFVSANMAERAGNHLKRSVDQLKETLAYKIRSVGDDILTRFEGINGGHTIRDYVNKSDGFLISRANNGNKSVNATSFNDLSSATEAVQHNLKKRLIKLKIG